MRKFSRKSPLFITQYYHETGNGDIPSEGATSYGVKRAFLDKVKDMADKPEVSRHAAGVAGKKANDLALATRINLQIFDLNTECEALYKEIGKLVYDLHRGAEVTNEEMDEKMAQVDAKQEKLAVLRDKLAEMRSVTACPHCGKPCGKDDAYCSSCGAEL